MRLRTKVLLLGVFMTMVSGGVLGLAAISALTETYRGELQTRARAFAGMIAAASVRDLAAGHIEDLDRLVASIEGLGEWDIRHIAMLDSQRRIVAHSDPSKYGLVALDQFSWDAAGSSEPIVEEYGRDLMLVGVPVRSGLAGLPGIRWGTVVVGIGLERAYSHLHRLMLGFGAIVLVAMALTGVALVMLLHREFVRPVQRITEAARAMANGELGRSCGIRRNDELGELGQDFDKMARRIENHTRELEEQVAARTRELAEANRQLSAANELLQSQAVSDGLTGLFNYRYFSATLEAELQRSRRTHQPVSLLMIDVDHFKVFNDTYGHPAGDKVLQDIADRLRARVRSTDVPCRYGGEEFAVILVATSRADAVLVAEDIRKKIEASRFADSNGQRVVPVTISVGVATFPGDADTPEGLVKAADLALYAAKQSGRNKVVAANSG